MSSIIISPEFGDELSDSSTVVGVDKTREEYLKLFSQASYSPLCDRPYSSPISGFYKAVNSTTSLVLLNHRFKNSHLREQVLPEELTSPIPQDFDYESFVVPVHISPTPKPTPKRHSPHIPVDPYRHFESTPNVNPSRSKSVNHRRSKSALVRKEQNQVEPQSFTESFCQYYRDFVEKEGLSEVNIPLEPVKEVPKQRVKSTGVRRKVPLTKGQQLYLIGKYHIYDIKDSKARRTNSYAQTLSNRYKTDFHCKPQFRLNDPHDYSKYSKFLQVPRSLSPSSSKKSTDTKALLTTKSFTLNNPKTPLTVRIHPEPKQNVTIPI